MSVDWKTFTLPEKAALDPGQGLPAFLQANRSHPVRLQAQALTATDTLLLQYLVAAERAWAARGLGFEVTGLRRAVSDGFARVGLTADHLTLRGEAA